MSDEIVITGQSGGTIPEFHGGTTAAGLLQRAADALDRMPECPTMRQYYKAAALQAILSRGNPSDLGSNMDSVVEDAGRYAGKMMAEDIEYEETDNEES